MNEKLSKDDKNRLAKWRQRLQRHFWSETDEVIFQKILDMNEAQAEPSKEWIDNFVEEKASKLYDFSTRWNLVDCADFIRNLLKESRKEK